MNILNELWLLFVALWNTGNRWARIAIAFFAGWPVVMIMAAISYRPAVPYVALLPLVALVALFIIWIDPLIIAVVAAFANGRKLLMAFVTGITVELLIGIFLTFVPVGNKPSLVAPLLLVSITLALMSASGIKSSKAKKALYVLVFFFVFGMFLPRTFEKKVVPIPEKLDSTLSGEAQSQPAVYKVLPAEAFTVNAGEKKNTVTVGPGTHHVIDSTQDFIAVSTKPDGSEVEYKMSAGRTSWNGAAPKGFLIVKGIQDGTELKIKEN